MSLLSQELLLPIIPTDLSFFQDSFFDQTRRYFEMAVKEIIERCGLSSTDHLSSYRRLRQKDLRTENRAVSVTDQQNDRKITMDVKDFKDDDLKVKTVGHDVVVEGQARAKKDGSMSNHTFRRRFTLPDVVDMAAVTATVSSDGILTVTAPKQNQTQQSTSLDPNEISDISKQKSTSSGISPSSFGSCPSSRKISEQKSTVETHKESHNSGEKNHHIISANSSSYPNKTHQKNCDKELHRGRNIKIRPMTPLPLLIRGSFFEDSFFRSAQKDFEVALNRILRKFDIDFSSDDFFNKYRILRDKHFTDETQAVNLSEDNSDHKIVLDVQDFKDGHVQVKAVGQTLVVEGRTEKITNGSKSTHTFRRQFSMPRNAKLTDVTAALSSDGILTILAKKDSKSRESKEVFIPIEVTGRYDKQENRESVTNRKTDQFTREISIDNWKQTKSTDQKTKKSKNEHIIPIELEGTDIKHLHEEQLVKQQQQQLLINQQEKLLEQEKKIQEQLQTLSQQEECLRQQQKDIDRQKQNYRKLQRRVRVEQMCPQGKAKSQSPPKQDEFPVIEESVKSSVTEEGVKFPVSDRSVKSPVTEEIVKSPLSERIVILPVTEERAMSPVSEGSIKSPVRETVDKSTVIEETDNAPNAQEPRYSRVPVVKNINISTAVPHTWQPTVDKEYQSTVQQDTRQSSSTDAFGQSQVTPDSYQTPVAKDIRPSSAVHHTWQPPVTQKTLHSTVQQDTSCSSVVEDTCRSPVANGLCMSPVEQEEYPSQKTSASSTDEKSPEQISEPQFYRSRCNRQRCFDQGSMDHRINSQGIHKQYSSNQESHYQTSRQQDSNSLEFNENEIVRDHYDNARSRTLPIRMDSTLSSMSSISEDLTNDATVENIKNDYNSARSRILPIRMDSTLSSVSSLSEDLTSDAEVADILQKSRKTSSDAKKTSSSEVDLLKKDFSLHDPQKMSLKDSSFPIERRGSFFQDSFFDSHQNLFQSAVSKVLDDFGIDSTFDDLTAYRTLRRSISSEASQAAHISEEEKEYKVVLDVHDFVGGEVRIKAEGQTLVVEGCAQKNEGNSSSSQSFRRCFTFPTSVDMEAVTSALSSDGVLTVTAPKSDHFSIVEVDDSGEVKEGSEPTTQMKQGSSSTCSRSSRSSTKTATGWREQSSFSETSFADGVSRETSTKTFQSSSTTGKLI